MENWFQKNKSHVACSKIMILIISAVDPRVEVAEFIENTEGKKSKRKCKARVLRTFSYCRFSSSVLLSRVMVSQYFKNPHIAKFWNILEGSSLENIRGIHSFNKLSSFRLDIIYFVPCFLRLTSPRNFFFCESMESLRKIISQVLRWWNTSEISMLNALRDSSFCVLRVSFFLSIGFVTLCKIEKKKKKYCRELEVKLKNILRQVCYSHSSRKHFYHRQICLNISRTRKTTFCNKFSHLVRNSNGKEPVLLKGFLPRNRILHELYFFLVDGGVRVCFI